MNRMWFSTALVWGVSLATFLAVGDAAAQFPFPGFETPKDRPAKEKSKEKESEEKVKTAKDEAPKIYTKPINKPLPEGPAKLLSGPIALIAFDGIVNPGMGEFTISSIERARQEGAQLVLIELNTPGGLVSTTQSMVQAILGSKLPVAVYVSPSGAHAASAGTIITLAADIAAMAPATRIGAAHPVTASGGDPEDDAGEHMGRKVENDLVAMVEGIAALRGRNVEWAIDAVRQSVSITAEKALEIGVVDIVATSRDELLSKIDGRELMVAGEKVKLDLARSTVLEYKPSIRQRVVNLLATPGIAMLLGILGLIGIMIEVYHPGLIVPGLMGVLCIICTLIAVEQLPIDLGGAILAIAGVGMLIAEIYTSTYGALGILGVIALATGALLLVDPSNPKFAIDKDFGLSLTDVLPLVALFAGFVAYISYAVVTIQKRKPVTGKEAMIGAQGRVLKPVDQQNGMVFVQGEYWKARSDVPIPEKEEVEVVSIDGLTLTVRPKKTTSGP